MVLGWPKSLFGFFHNILRKLFLVCFTCAGQLVILGLCPILLIARRNLWKLKCQIIKGPSNCPTPSLYRESEAQRGAVNPFRSRSPSEAELGLDHALPIAGHSPCSSTALYHFLTSPLF